MFRTRPTALLLLPIFAFGCKSEPEPPSKTNASSKAQPNSAPSSKPASKPVDASVQFITPQEGSTVFPEVAVAMGVEGMGVRPAGEDPEDRTTGHHHILIDQPEGVPEGTVVPATETSIHYGKGQTTTYVQVPEGEHTLTLQFADGAHRSYGSELSSTIKVNVVPSKGERSVEFLAPKDGAKVKSPVSLKMGVSGMEVRPAGEDTLDKTSGHHHIVIDGEPIPIGVIVPSDERHIHYGKGQTEASVELSPGEHTLTMQFADGAHASYGPKMSATIKVTVEE